MGDHYFVKIKSSTYSVYVLLNFEQSGLGLVWILGTEYVRRRLSILSEGKMRQQLKEIVEIAMNV